jgi:probable 2-oxoglutarate dehydrogenase E1 component DHKTD1
MLHRSFGRHAGQRALSAASADTGQQQQLQSLVVGLLRRQLAAAAQRRSVTTSKHQQAAAHQRRSQQKEQDDCDEHHAGGPGGASRTTAEAAAGLRKRHQARLDNLGLWHSVDSIKRLGHRLAPLDPLQLRKPEQLAELSWSHALLDQLRSNTDIVATRGFLDTKQPLMAVNELLDSVWNIYANNGGCGLEFAYMSNEHEIEWLTSNWERLNETFHLDYPAKHHLAKLMLECEAFDQFMAAKFPTVKRYGCEGAESMLVALDEVLRLCQLGETEQDDLTRPLGRINDVIIGMPHRGRLNLLACLLGFEPEAIISKTKGEPELDLAKAWMGRGDVLSHLSTNCRFVYGLDQHNIGLSRDSPDPINVSLLPNPSHLEVASPLAMGVARGRAHNIQHGYSSSPKFPPTDRYDPTSSSYDQHLTSVLPIQIHGDASLAGQGIVQESLQMSNLPQFTCGGSLHLVVNNQIGYTTEPEAGRSSRHCTDIFKLIEAPVIHVNGQNISGVVRATRLALAYRQRFGKDVAINLVCYRQHGHNELDEPAFTQPIMYSRIKRRKSIPQTFCDEIKMKSNERQDIQDDIKARLQEAYKRVDRYKPDNDNYRNFELATEYHRDHLVKWQTGFELDKLRDIALESVRVPVGFKVHPNLERVLVNERLKRFGAANDDDARLGKTKVDWASAEILAFGSLLMQNHSVRLAGQDVARGTFSTRHAVLYDQDSQRAHVPLNEMPAIVDNEQTRARLEVANTILSEEASMAYEFGYSIETCQLTIWEAQFGDFFSTAQSIIDTLVSSSESKWLKQSALTLLLPHGLDGAGPEHSSAHLERFLQMSSSSLSSAIDTEAKCNWSVCYPTLPSQYFHLLRRQVLRPFRKPLVVMSPKVIFRHPECQSELADFGPDKCFQTILDDPARRTPEQRDQVDTVVLCSGKIYFQLDELRTKHSMDNVALIRIEELCPFPVQSIMETIKQYKNVEADGYVWCQEEHENQGAYSFVEARLSSMANMSLTYLGRPASELPATGSSLLHKRELDQLTKEFVALKR